MSEPDDTERRRRLRAALDLELVPEQTDDETGASWGEPPSSEAAELRRYQEERPPHHL